MALAQPLEGRPHHGPQLTIPPNLRHLHRGYENKCEEKGWESHDADLITPTSFDTVRYNNARHRWGFCRRAFGMSKTQVNLTATCSDTTNDEVRLRPSNGKHMLCVRVDACRAAHLGELPQAPKVKTGHAIPVREFVVFGGAVLTTVSKRCSSQGMGDLTMWSPHSAMCQKEHQVPIQVT